jgi:hypothetical protein
MFDAGHVLVFAWAFVRVVRARLWGEAAVLAVAAYVFALTIASGFAIRANGPMAPMMGLLLIFMGPSTLPRGALPPLPFAALVVRWPAMLDAAICVALLFVARRVVARVERLPQFAESSHRISRAALAIVLVAVFAGLAASIRLLPDVLVAGDESGMRAPR